MTISCLTLILFSIIFTSCTKDPYKDYVTSGLEPMTKVCDYSNEKSELWSNNANKILIFNDYKDYNNFGIDLGYTEGFFEQNSLMLLLDSTNSSDNDKFVDVLVNEGKLCPVVEYNYIKEDDPVTDDIILYIFYSEFKTSDNYTAGEIIRRVRNENDNNSYLHFATKSEAACFWQENKNYPNVNVIRSYDDFILYRQGNEFVSTEYEADFFNDCFLIVVELETTNSAQSYCIDKVIYENEQFIVYINNQNAPNDSGGSTVMGEYLVFIEISNTIYVLDSNITIENN